MSKSVSTQSELGADFVVNNLGRLVQGYHSAAPSKPSAFHITGWQHVSLNYTQDSVRPTIKATVAMHVAGTYCTTSLFYADNLLVLCAQELLPVVEYFWNKHHTSYAQKVQASFKALLGDAHLAVLVPQTKLSAENIEWLPNDKLLKCNTNFTPRATLKPSDLRWVVNSEGEVGVQLDGRAFFCRYGRSLEYAKPEMADDTYDSSGRNRAGLAKNQVLGDRPVFVREVGRLELGQQLLVPEHKPGELYSRSEPDVPWEPLIGYGDGSYTAS